jgi:CHAT domain-containing protein/tetratricopeptide (TPR) repeat protein
MILWGYSLENSPKELQAKATTISNWLVRILQKTGLSVCVLLMLPLAGEVGETLRPPGTPSRQTQQGPSPLRESFAARLRVSGDLLRQGRYRDAQLSAQRHYEAALRAGDAEFAAKFLANSATCRFALHEYREALETFGEAARLAVLAENTSAAGVIDANISSVYEQMGDLEASAAYARKAAARLAGQERRMHLPKVLIHLASLRSRQGRLHEAAGLFREGIEAADAASDLDTYALGWDRRGEESLKRGDLPAAEDAFLEAWRVRKLNRLAALATSYRNLGRLRLAQGDLPSAEALLDQAVASARSPRGMMPMWDSYHARGLVRLARGRPEAALADLRVAARLARAWRAGLPPSDAGRAGGEQMTEPVHASLARAAATLHFQTGRRDLLETSFEAVEENRGLGLRALLEEGAGRRRRLPPEYWETMARLQRCEVALLRHPEDAAARAEAEVLRGALAEMENRDAPSPSGAEPGLLARLRHALPPDAAWFSFQLSEPDSYLWAADRTGAALYRLPGRRELAREGARFHAAVQDGLPDTETRARRLFDLLFGRVERRFTARRRWLVGADDELLALPLAALRENGRYVVERHTIQVVSSAVLAARSGGRTWRAALDGTFLGVGDPIYNTADRRWKAASTVPFGLLQARDDDGVQLPRLVAGSREVRECAGAWGRPGAVLLEGPGASKTGLRRALSARPAVTHLATHILPSGLRGRYGLIALSLREKGSVELVAPAEVAAWDAPVGLVTLSGCSSGVAPGLPENSLNRHSWLKTLGFSSGSGPALPDRGLMGLTRAWLAAGAGAVAATRWPVRDGTAAVLQVMYRRLMEDPESGPAAALAAAQVEMIESGGWRSRPQYWGAFFVVSNQ